MSVAKQDTSQIKSKERVAERGEVFTAEREVNAMCDLVANECLRPDSRFLEPACGDGNFLAVILKRKLAELRRKYKKCPRDYEKQAIIAMGSLYGVDIMNDNVVACRERLYKIWNEEYTAHCKNDASDEAEEHILLAATDKFGNKMEHDFVVRLLSIPAKVVSYQDTIIADELGEIIETEQDNLLEKLELRNSDLITTEIMKVENWAEDNRKALQQKLTELDKAIDEKNNEFVSERNVRKKLAIQKEKDALNDKRDAAWREFDQKREELKKDKNKIISHLYELADGKMEIVDEYTIKWIIK